MTPNHANLSSENAPEEMAFKVNTQNHGHAPLHPPKQKEKSPLDPAPIRQEDASSINRTKSTQGRMSSIENHPIFRTLESADCMVWEAKVDCFPDDWSWHFTIYPSGLFNKLFGESLPPENVGLWYRFQLPDQVEMDARSRKAMLSGESGYTHEFRVIKKGVLSWIRESVTITATGGETFWLVGVASDITPLRSPQEETGEKPQGVQSDTNLHKSRFLSTDKQIEQFFNQSLYGFFICMLDQPIHWDENTDKQEMIEFVLDHQRMSRVNRAMLDQYGAEEEDFVGVSMRDLFKHDLKQAREICEGLFDNGKWHIETHEQKLDGTLMVIEGDYICLYDDEGRITGHLGVQIDVTELKKTRQALIEQTELQKTLMDISNDFINVPLDKSEEAIHAALSLLGQFTGTDRAYVFRYDHDHQMCHNTHEWCTPGIAPGFTDLQSVAIDAIPEWTAAHFSGQPLHIADVLTLEPDNRVRQILEPQGIKSLLAIPMMDGGICIGFVGFDSVRRNHDFSEKESALLTLFAHMLVNVLSRNRVQEELKASKEKAEAASKAKSQFLANMSHEIRTPLNGVIGFTDLLKNTPLTPVQEQYVQHANVSGHTLLGIINDILDFSKIEAGMMALEIIKTDMIELLENSVDVVKFAAEKKNLEILLDIDSKMPRFAMVDPVRLKQILANLLGNAVKFTEKGEVELKVRYGAIDKTRGTFSFSIRDTGIGISETQKKKLFKAFSQADSSTTRKFGGTGLGLIISDMIAKKMGSKIEIDSVLDEGTTFHFDLISDTEPGKARDLTDLCQIKSCLIIDDNANNRLILEHLLARWNIESKACDNGLTALKILETSKAFDAVICDYNMPYVDGLETIRKIREKLEMGPDEQPIILLHSSSEDVDLHDKCKALGVRFCITKPVKQEHLFACLATLQVESQNNLSPVVPIHQEVTKDPESLVEGNNSITVLLAEDVPMNMLLARTLLKHIIPHATIVQAENGKTALEKYQQTDPDLILMDVQMPEMDGLEATQAIRSIERNTGKHVPIVALTAGALKEEMDLCLQSGMDAFLTKPIDPRKLRELLKAMF